MGRRSDGGAQHPDHRLLHREPGSSVKDINNALARGQNLILTPGIYDIAQTIQVKKADTVVLGMGHATLTAVGGAVPLEIKDAAGIIVAGITIDAGTTLSPVRLRVGSATSTYPVPAGQPDHAQRRVLPRRRAARRQGDDRARGQLRQRAHRPHLGVARRPRSRRIHGPDTERWNTNIGTNGVIVNGDNVTATGLFVEHFQTYNTLWNGENGRVILYQNELPYDPPTQADWTQPDGTLGYPGYKVADDVTTHRLDGGGVYVFNQNNPSIVTENGFTVPETPGVQLHHIMTVNLSAGTILHVVNGVGVWPTRRGSECLST